jgi:choline dehydrogenase-like flavoprotein
LLQRSGIGEGALLRGLGIPLVVDAPGVGKNLQEHFNYKSKYRVRKGSLNAQYKGLRLLANMARYMLLHDGPMARSVWEVGGFVKTQLGLARPDAQIGVGLYSIAPKGGTDQFPALVMSGYTVNPRSRGSLTIVSPDIAVPPRIEANFLGEEEDRISALALARYIRRICAQPALRDFIVAEEEPGPGVTSEQDLLEAFAELASTAFHVCGTCRMGNDAQSVVDPQLRVRGVDGLRVVDTSIFPTLVSGNTNAPAMATALRAAQFILAER